jgi:hypothetical protein
VALNVAVRSRVLAGRSVEAAAGSAADRFSYLHERDARANLETVLDLIAGGRLTVVLIVGLDDRFRDCSMFEPLRVTPGTVRRR